MSEKLPPMTPRMGRRTQFAPRPSRNLYNKELGRRIIDRICEYYQIKVEDLMTQSRSDQIPWVRHLAMDVMAMAGLSTQTIGTLLARERSTVSYARDKVEDSCKLFPDLSDDRKKIAGEFIDLGDECRTWTCSAALGDSPWRQIDVGMKQLHLLSETNFASESCESIGQPCQSSTTSATLTAPNSRACDYSQVDFLVNLTATPGSSLAREMTVRLGRKCSELLRNQGRVSSWAKMLLVSSTWNSTTCLLRWRAQNTPHNRLLFRLSPSTPDTDEIESGFSEPMQWPTPQANEDAAGSPNGKMQPMLGNHPALRASGNGTLTPMFVAHLMGYAIGHTDCAGLETQSCPKSPSK